MNLISADLPGVKVRTTHRLMADTFNNILKLGAGLKKKKKKKGKKVCYVVPEIPEYTSNIHTYTTSGVVINVFESGRVWHDFVFFRKRNEVKGLLLPPVPYTSSVRMLVNCMIY